MVGIYNGTVLYASLATPTPSNFLVAKAEQKPPTALEDRDISDNLYRYDTLFEDSKGDNVTDPSKFGFLDVNAARSIDISSMYFNKKYLDEGTRSLANISSIDTSATYLKFKNKGFVKAKDGTLYTIVEAFTAAGSTFHLVPTRNTGISRRSSDLQKQQGDREGTEAEIDPATIAIDPENLNINTVASTFNYPADSSFFRAIYTDDRDNLLEYDFVMLPAKETKGGWNVPEAKLGMPIQTKMKYRIQTIPGAGPVVQTVGIGGTTVTLVGALFGNEVVDKAYRSQAPSSLFKSDNGQYYPNALPLGSYQKARELTERLVLPGKVVIFEIKGPQIQSTYQMGSSGATGNIKDTIFIKGVPTSLRIHHAAADRTYYALDVFITEYNSNKTRSISATTTSKASTTTASKPSTALPQQSPTTTEATTPNNTPVPSFSLPENPLESVDLFTKLGNIKKAQATEKKVQNPPKPPVTNSTPQDNFIKPTEAKRSIPQATKIESATTQQITDIINVLVQQRKLDLAITKMQKVTLGRDQYDRISTEIQNLRLKITPEQQAELDAISRRAQ